MKLKPEKLIGEKVMVYYNLNKHTFSVTHKGIVMFYSDHIKLSDVEFRVRETGRKKVLKENRKNVHAFVIGTLVNNYDNLSEPNCNKIITYDPYKYETFVNKTTIEPIYNAKLVEMVNLKNKIFVID